MSKLYLTTRFKFFRTAKSWTQQEYADFLGVAVDVQISRDMVQKWERGTRPIAPGVAMAIAKAIKVDFKELVEKK